MKPILDRASRVAAVFLVLATARVTFAAEPAATSTTSSTSSTPVTTSTSSSTTTQNATQNADDDSDAWAGVRTVVVSATRAETEIAKTGTSISVVSQKEIEREQYRSVSDALSQVPGVNVSSTGTPGQASTIMIRGAKTSENSILVDGRRLPFDLAGASDLENLSLINVDRVEVLRGPSSSVAGGPAIGGVINIISRDGRGQGTPKTETFFEAGSYNTYREGISSWGSEKDFDYSVGLVRTDTSNQRDNDEYRNTGSLNKFGYQINPDLYFDTHIIYSLADVGTPGDRFTPDPTSNTLRELWGVSPGLTWQTNDIWTQSIYYSRYQYRQVSSDNTISYYPDNRVQCDTDQVDYQSTVKIFDNWSVTGGFSGTNLSYYRKLDEDSWPSTGGTKDIDDGQTNTGYFLESRWEIMEGWNLVNNGRFDHYSDFGDAFTYRAATSYEVPEVKTLLHANYGTSYAPPTPQDIAPIFYTEAPDLKPEKSKGYEFGAEQPFWGGKVTAFGTWFHNDITDKIIYTPTGLYTGTMTNAAKAVTEGIETGFTIKPIKQVGVRLSYTNMSAIRKADSLQDDDTHLTRVPRHTVNAAVTYQPIDPLTFVLSGSYVADRQDSNYSVQSGKQIDIENYINLRFTANYKVNSYLEVYGRIENLTNDQYEEVLGYPALDQALYGGFKVTF